MICTDLHDWVYQDDKEGEKFYACAHCGLPEDDTVQEPDWDLIGKEKDFD